MPDVKALPRVIAKVVRRYFACGRGFSSKQQAYIHVAKQELNEQANEFAPDDLEGFKKFYAQRFPLPPHTECKHFGCSCWQEKFTPSLEEDPDEIFPSGTWEVEPCKAYCNKDRWVYLRARARELSALAEASRTRSENSQGVETKALQSDSTNEVKDV
jgi:hypothetical protein